MFRALTAITLVASIAGTAAAQTPGDGHWAEDGGDVIHIPSGARCPSEYFSMQRVAAQSLRPDGSDAACQYARKDKAILSIFVTDFGAKSFEEVMADADRAVISAKGHTPDPAAGDACDAVIDAALSEQTAQIGATSTPQADCALYDDRRLTSLLATERLGRWTVKIRITTADTSDGVDGRLTGMARDVLLDQRRIIGSAQ